MLFLTLLFLLIFYFVWLPLSYYNKIQVEEEFRASEMKAADAKLERSTSGLGPGTELATVPGVPTPSVSSNPMH